MIAKEIKKKARQLDDRLYVVWEDLGQAMDSPENKWRYIGPAYVQSYRETVKLLKESQPTQNWQKYDLDFLKKAPQELSVNELQEWRDCIPEVRGYLENIVEDCK